MAQYKFDDCYMCRFRRKKHICRDCDYGEQFEDEDVQELDFSVERSFDRSGKSLVTDDDEPNHNPDDLIDRYDTDSEPDFEDDSIYDRDED